MKNILVIGTIIVMAAMLQACASKTNKTDTSKTTAAAPAASPAPTTDASKDNPGKIENGLVKETECVKGKDDRVVKWSKSKTGCEVLYQKFGKEKAIATGEGKSHHCEDVFGRVEKKLTDAGFTCKQ